MKNSLEYLKLWHKKRSELKITDDPKADWQQMQTLLDRHMPVSKVPGNGKLLHVTHFKLFSALFIGLTAAVVVYYTYHRVIFKPQQQRINHHQKQQNNFNADRLLNNSGVDSGESKQLAIDKGKRITIDNKDSLVNNVANAPVNKNVTNLHASSNMIAAGTVNGVRSKDKLPLSRADTRNGLAINNLKGNKALAQLQSGVSIANHHKNFAAGVNKNKSTLNSNKSTALFNGKRHSIKTDESTLGKEFQQKDELKTDFYYHQNSGSSKIELSKPALHFGAGNLTAFDYGTINNEKIKSQDPGKSKADKKEKKTKISSSDSNLDFGILTGFNSAGSFTPKAQNHNIYGSSPIDLFFGLFAAYNVSDKWAVNTKITLLNPQNISGSYTHANQSKADSGQQVKITGSSKIYAVSIPINIVYKTTGNISFMAGPVISIPIKQSGISSSLSPAGIKTDSAYYASTTALINNTKFQQKLNIGLSAGAGIQVNRLIFEANYLKSISGYKAGSTLGSYNSHSGTFQVTIGFQLSKPKSSK